MYRPPRFYLDDINIFLKEFSDIGTTKSNDYIGDMNLHYDTDGNPLSLFINVLILFHLFKT